VVRHTRFAGDRIEKVALCTGSGAFLIGTAAAAGADAFLTADLKYHDFFDAGNRMLLADVGHYESERWVKGWLHDVLIEKFPTFAFLISETDTNPVQYL
jgi:putative NIF3 family GTP cyclohydrolase 1 type 2